MSRRVRVKAAGDNPRSILWKGRWHPVVDIMELWRDTGEWWQGETEKLFYRLRLSDGSLLEIYRAGEEWFLYKVYD
ncbi:MAG: DUF6504 family protein [Bacillota bacterium]|jgi:hypothetical protein